MAPEATLPPGDVNVPGDYFSLAGFEVNLYGRFWLTPEEFKASLDARLKQLQQESIRQALLRVVREVFSEDEEPVRAIDDAYALRSKMLHEGTTDPYLDRKTHEVERIIRRIYPARVGKPLKIGN